jgi:hypothetical protein
LKLNLQSELFVEHENSASDEKKVATKVSVRHAATQVAFLLKLDAFTVPTR